MVVGVERKVKVMRAMKTKSIFKIIICLFVLLCYLAVSVSFATTPAGEVGDALGALNPEGGSAASGSVDETLRNITNILTSVAFIVCVVKMMQIGFKFMMMPANKRSDAKASLVPWAVGVVICTMWFTLGGWVFEMLSDPDIAPAGPFDLPF